MLFKVSQWPAMCGAMATPRLPGLGTIWPPAPVGCTLRVARLRGVRVGRLRGVRVGAAWARRQSHLAREARGAHLTGTLISEQLYA